MRYLNTGDQINFSTLNKIITGRLLEKSTNEIVIESKWLSGKRASYNIDSISVLTSNKKFPNPIKFYSSLEFLKGNLRVKDHVIAMHLSKASTTRDRISRITDNVIGLKKNYYNLNIDDISFIQVQKFEPVESVVITAGLLVLFIISIIPIINLQISPGF